MQVRPAPLRIAALSVAIAVHVALGLVLFIPSRPLQQIAIDSSLAVTYVALPNQPLSAPPPPRRVKPPQPSRQTAQSPPRPATPDDATQASSTATGASGPPQIWQYDPNAGITMVVYGDRGAVDVPAPEQAPAEISGYRAGFDPTLIDGLNGVSSGGSVTFDVLVDESGVPTALAVVRQQCGQRALETAMSVVSQWRFVPARRAGISVPGWIQVSLAF